MFNFLRKLDHLFSTCTQSSCLIFSHANMLWQENATCLYRLIKDGVSVSDRLMFQLFSFTHGLSHPVHNASMSGSFIS